ncbi:hypothetical protein [Kamptonema sp. UHCC 0994]|uniref:hypothetical protein n=1 Tax=Kamptonema sp. UHCC 0994 TaxID=3031329 RepID=UPI0023B8E3DE|nr:hypothetical protein [Kamptonema sp. UHCC 0994]MDF0552971.1 hypothetical protein [Kamptonema sp. UHCC 0994]
MTEPNYQALAKQGNPEAIAFLLNQQLESQGIAVTTNLTNGCLEVFLESEQVPDRYELIDFVRNQLTNIEPDSIQRAKVEGKKTGSDSPAWSQGFGLEVGSYSMLTFPPEPSQNSEPISEPSSNYTEVKQPEPIGEDRMRTTTIIVALVIGILGISVAAFVNKMVAVTEIKADNISNQAATNSPKPSQSQSFRNAVNIAINASKLAQSAQTEEEWNLVASQWEEAVTMMKKVPPESANYQLAQKKALEYQKNLAYAQESAKPKPPKNSIINRKKR